MPELNDILTLSFDSHYNWSTYGARFHGTQAHSRRCLTTF